MSAGDTAARGQAPGENQIPQIITGRATTGPSEASCLRAVFIGLFFTLLTDLHGISFPEVPESTTHWAPYTQKSIAPRFRRPEAQDRGLGRAGFFRGHQREFIPCLSPGFWRLLARFDIPEASSRSLSSWPRGRLPVGMSVSKSALFMRTPVILNYSGIALP